VDFGLVLFKLLYNASISNLVDKRVALYTTAIKLIIKEKIQPEKAFDLAYKRLKMKESREELYNQFLHVLQHFYYNYELYHEEGIEEVVLHSLDGGKIDLPQWVKERLSYLRIKDFSLLFKKYTWIRINTLKAKISEVVESLKKKGFELERDEYDYLYKVLKMPYRISKTEEFQNGKIVIQDKASVKVIEVLSPKPGERILEIGSAPGMKTSLIQQLTENKAYVIAVDVSEKRIENQRELMKRLGVENVELVLADGKNLPINHVDKILIDAPCTNSGTLASDPSVFLRINKKDVLRLSRLQREILEEASKLKKPVVYSTCSLFPDEGEKVVEKFADYLVKINENEGPSHYGYFKSKVWLRVLRFYPHLHGTQGFFIAKLDFSKSPSATHLLKS